MNSEFLSNIRAIFGPDGEAWLANLPFIVEQLRQLWDLPKIWPIEHLTYNYCCFAENKTGQKFVIKIAPDEGVYTREVSALQSFLGGVPKVVAVSAKHRAYLMERLSPGKDAKSIVQEGNDDAATRIVARAIRQLKPKPGASGFKHMIEFIPSLDMLRPHLDARSFEKLSATFQSITTDRTNDVLLHGDLHHGNVLAHGDDWIAIDPHGYLGHPAAEVGAMIRNPWDAFPTDKPLRAIFDRRLNILKEELGYDLQMMNAWAYCITSLSEVWSLEDQGPSHRVDLEFLSALEDRVV